MLVSAVLMGFALDCTFIQFMSGLIMSSLAAIHRASVTFILLGTLSSTIIRT